MKTKNITLITVTLIMLGVYNALYWSAKFLNVLPGFYHNVMAHWKLITFLEFLAVASVVVDLIVRFDQFEKSAKNFRITLTATVTFLFFLRFLLGMIELYMRGEVR